MQSRFQGGFRGGLWVAALLLAALVGCASTPPEAVWPEQEVNIRDMRANHALQPQIPLPAQDLVRDRSHNTTVLLQLHVGADGQVLRSRLSPSNESQNPVLDKAALESVGDLRFEPYRGNGAAQAVTVVAPVVFLFYDRPR
ncbi:energy transducer TonB [Rhodoferax sp.]|uniref:energy transducer TonB family protein n=1 Tax=Rhodoferax sp. TaxID=50421 RepID=UPI00374D557D